MTLYELTRALDAVMNRLKQEDPLMRAAAQYGLEEATAIAILPSFNLNRPRAQIRPLWWNDDDPPAGRSAKSRAVHCLQRWP
jgi:hypothetical protein